MARPPHLRTTSHWRQRLEPVLQPFVDYGGRLKSVLFHRAKKESKPTGTGVAARPDFHWLILMGSLLSFSAGWINAFSYLAANVGVSHVTGSVTKAGMAFTTGSDGVLEICFGLWLSFFIGGVFAGMIIVNESFAMGRSYGHAFIVVSIFLFWASMWAAYFPDNPNWIFVAAMACGIQNGVTTRYSGNVVRTTHMTGLTTDVGIVVGHILRCHVKAETWKLKLYVPMLLSFLLGGLLCREAWYRYRHLAMIFPTVFVFCLGVGYIGMLSRVRKQPFRSVLLHRVSHEILTPHSPTSIRRKMEKQASMMAIEKARQDVEMQLGEDDVSKVTEEEEEVEGGRGVDSPDPIFDSQQIGAQQIEVSVVPPTI